MTLKHPFANLAHDSRKVMEAIVAKDIGHASFVNHPMQPFVPMDIGWVLKAGLERSLYRRIPSADSLKSRLDDRAAGKVPVQCPLSATKRGSYEMMRFANRFPAVWIGMMAATAASVVWLAVR